MRSFILFLISFIFVTTSLVMAEEVALTLDEALAIGLRDNRQILLKAQDAQKAKLKIREAQASLLPSLTLSGGWTKTRGYYSKDISQTQAQATIKQALYAGGRIINTIRLNEYGLSVAEAVLDKTKLEIAYQVKKAFYTLLLAKEFATLNEGVFQNTQEHLEFIKERFQNGQASESEILSLESALGSVEQALEVSANQVQSAQGLLNNLLYLDTDTRIRPDAEFTYEPRDVAFDEAFLQALKERPEIKQYEAQRMLSQKAVEVAKADNRPSIYASWDYYSRSHTAALTGLSKNWSDYNVIGVTISWPIFDGWATQAKVEQAIVDLKQSLLLKEKTVTDIALELKNAYLDLKNAIAKIKTSESEGKLYADQVESARERYSEGIASSLALSDAELQHEISLFNKENALYDYIIAKSSFEKATGGGI